MLVIYGMDVLIFIKVQIMHHITVLYYPPLVTKNDVVEGGFAFKLIS